MTEQKTKKYLTESPTKEIVDRLKKKNPDKVIIYVENSSTKSSVYTALLYIIKKGMKILPEYVMTIKIGNKYPHPNELVKEYHNKLKNDLDVLTIQIEELTVKPDEFTVSRLKEEGKFMVYIKKLKSEDFNVYLVDSDTTFGKLMMMLKKKINLKPEVAIFLYIDNIHPSNSELISYYHSKYKNDIGLLEITYTEEEVFG